MAGRIYLANVGANASHRFAGPIFPDRTFEFLPIPEDRDLAGPHAVRYRDLRSFYDPQQDLVEYIPKRLWGWPTHNDPEFESFTYGDNCSVNARAASLRRVERGDFIFFISGLEERRDGEQTGVYGFYLVGYLEVEEILPEVTSRLDQATFARYRSNAHVRRGLSDPGLWDRFWVFAGSSGSERFRRAVPVTRELANRVFTAADGQPWRWSETRTELQVIGSYTRSCRCVVDPVESGGRARADLLWKWVGQHQP